MARFSLGVGLSVAMAAILLAPSMGAAASFKETMRKCIHAQPPYNHVTDRGISVGTPSPGRYTGGAACQDWYGYGFGVPTFNWGYFGAHYNPVCICHKGYYGDQTQWSYRRGY